MEHAREIVAAASTNSSVSDQKGLATKQAQVRAIAVHTGAAQDSFLLLSSCKNTRPSSRIAELIATVYQRPHVFQDSGVFNRLFCIEFAPKPAMRLGASLHRLIQLWAEC